MIEGETRWNTSKNGTAAFLRAEIQRIEPVGREEEVQRMVGAWIGQSLTHFVRWRQIGRRRLGGSSLADRLERNEDAKKRIRSNSGGIVFIAINRKYITTCIYIYICI